MLLIIRNYGHILATAPLKKELGILMLLSREDRRGRRRAQLEAQPGLALNVCLERPEKDPPTTNCSSPANRFVLSSQPRVSKRHFEVLTGVFSSSRNY